MALESNPVGLRMCVKLDAPQVNEPFLPQVQESLHQLRTTGPLALALRQVSPATSFLRAMSQIAISPLGLLEVSLVHFLS